MNETIYLPPPWLINMQRYGPPPSYQGLKIPGLNSPIPAGCRYGYGPYEWGKPPVDQNGHPLYGSVFSTTETLDNVIKAEENVDKTFEWGRIEELSEVDETIGFEDSHNRPRANKGIYSTATPLSSQVSQNMETPSILSLRKDGGTSENPLSQTSDKQPFSQKQIHKAATIE